MNPNEERAMADVDKATLLDIASRIGLYRKGLAELDLSDADLAEIQTLIGIHLRDDPTPEDDRG